MKLPPGASSEAIAAAEAKLGVTLPAEARAFYLAHLGELTRISGSSWRR